MRVTVYAQPYLLAAPPQTEIYLQVLSGTLHVADRREDLTVEPQGLELTSAHGVVHLDWQGEIWVRGETSGTRFAYIAANKRHG